MTEKLTNQQREYEAQQMHRQHLQVCNYAALERGCIVNEQKLRRASTRSKKYNVLPRRFLIMKYKTFNKRRSQ